eukprot:scaffold1744_cov340-Prasinococcus_capsulatus_cf.AAC.10
MTESPAGTVRLQRSSWCGGGSAEEVGWPCASPSTTSCDVIACMAAVPVQASHIALQITNVGTTSPLVQGELQPAGCVQAVPRSGRMVSNSSGPPRSTPRQGVHVCYWHISGCPHGRRTAPRRDKLGPIRRPPLWRAPSCSCHERRGGPAEPGHRTLWSTALDAGRAARPPRAPARP